MDILFAILIVCGLVWLGRRATNARGSSVPSVLRPTTRARQSGEIGEARTQLKLRESLTELCGPNFYLHEGPLIVEHAPGTPFPTAEIDHLVVTTFGILLIETKNWTGHIAASSSADELIRTAASGEVEIRKSPIAQNRSKLAFFRTRLPSIWPIQSVGVFASDDVSLAPGLPTNLIRLNDLPYWLRLRQSEHRGKPPVDVVEAARGALMYADLTAGAARRHIDRVSQ